MSLRKMPGGAALLMVGLLAGCHQDTLHPYLGDGMQIRLQVSGGFAGVDYSVVLDGASRNLVAESCTSFCDFSPGEVLNTLTPEQVEQVFDLFQGAGIHEANGSDFGYQCCDQYHYYLEYRDDLGASTIQGSSEALPEALKEAVSSVMALLNGTMQLVVDFDRSPDTWPRDPLEIQAPEVSGNLLSVRVSYGGGCKVHVFQGVAHGGWTDSDPVQVRVLLSHEDSDDLCEVWLTRDLQFDLTPLKQAYEETFGANTSEATTLQILLEDDRLANPLGAWQLDYRF